MDNMHTLIVELKIKFVEVVHLHGQLRQCFRSLDIVNQDRVHGLLCNGTLVIEMQKFFTAIGCTQQYCVDRSLSFT